MLTNWTLCLQSLYICLVWLRINIDNTKPLIFVRETQCGMYFEYFGIIWKNFSLIVLSLLRVVERARHWLRRILVRAKWGPGASSCLVVRSCAVRTMETEFCNEYLKAQGNQRYADGRSTCSFVFGGQVEVQTGQVTATSSLKFWCLWSSYIVLKRAYPMLHC